MSNEDLDARAVVDRWVAGMLARRAGGDDKAVWRGLYETHQRVKRIAEEEHPEARDVLQPLLDVLREAMVEEFDRWQRRRRQ